jgi:hypothetical protein
MPSYSGVFTLQAQMQAKAASNWPPFPPAIGAAYEGGFYAGQISTAGNGIADYNLVIGPIATAQSTALDWKTSNTGGDPTSVIDGPTNSSTMNSATYPTAQFCEGLTIGGFTDWYMPAKNELEVCYYNLKPRTPTSQASSGINANAVPARASNYTAGNPAQTSATAFKEGGAEALSSGYWSSTQFSTTEGSFQTFYNGGQYGYTKFTGSGFKVRAIRRVAV